MEDLAVVFHELGMTQYLHRFIGNGFETWNDVLEITEIDLYGFNKSLLALNIMQRLQQRVAKERNDFRNRPAQQGEYSNCSKQKRRYQWHPKPDPNAPKKPLTAYAVFANEKRAELQYKALSFPEMAIEIGRLWRELPENEKKIAQARATQAREEYKIALGEYENSDNYNTHVRYLNEWKARNSTDRRMEEKRSQSNTSSPQYVERSPVSMETSAESQLNHALRGGSLRNTLPNGWGSSNPCHLVEHIPDTFGWSLSHKNPHNQIGGDERLFDNAPSTLSSLNMRNGDIDVEYEDDALGCTSFWSAGSRH
ncbi:uncharacterized protein PADG_06819 [Paracoccidioides brasiliensis Pb18]|uniref:HMG box domain-containing protein n=2 Tax=Paracoccidioides brasiliensis TaxID=121759 RepID=C1GHT3_PARBD|nr:uncharacterized protein PADG_06819 [Paracoccidioides brasiliensis Pb18]EEH50740.2 hypothetical protein PADG_06819 [Paracoccidioides brasiliensis Pb18]ODH39359.1 hypothetical protein ACO22_01927 [Paracoccidioides brasiliensis]ODH47635.1 hypothetical protein GX48_06252 [Paracoccidioides brasiliensis]